VMINKEVEDDKWKHVHLIKEGPGLTHFLCRWCPFVCKRKGFKVRLINSVLEPFCSLPGLKVS